jgi:serine/threonine protein kinase
MLEIALTQLPCNLGQTTGEPDHRSDLYSLGAALWRLLAGRRMFNSHSVRTVLNDVLLTQPPLLHTVRPDIPDILSHIINKLLAKRPEDRYARWRTSYCYHTASMLTPLNQCKWSERGPSGM